MSKFSGFRSLIKSRNNIKGMEDKLEKDKFNAYMLL